MNQAEMKNEAAAVADQLQALGGGTVPGPLRDRFIRLRTALFQRGIYNPVLGRFDSYSAPRCSAAEVAEQLTSVASGL